MKEIRFCLLHPYAKDEKSALDYLQIQELSSKYKFIWDQDSPDYLIASEQIYTNKKLYKDFKAIYKKSKIAIFFTREAQTPDYNIFDYAISFDSHLFFSDRFVQLPTAFDLYPAFVSKKQNDIVNIEDATRELNIKTGFCNFLYSNPKAHPMRDRLFYSLSKYKKVDSLGRHLNNANIQGTGYKGHESDCVKLKERYKFSIASENASFPGYTSEKILTSLAAHTIPIYFGDPEVEEIFNPRCFINVNKYKSLDEVVQTIKEIDEDEDAWKQIIMEPWQTPDQVLKSQERLSNYISFFDKLFIHDCNDEVKRPIGCRPDMYLDFFNNVHMRQRNKIIISLYKQYQNVRHKLKF